MESHKAALLDEELQATNDCREIVNQYCPETSLLTGYTIPSNQPETYSAEQR